MLDAAAIRSRVEHLVGRGSSPSPADLLLTPRARQVLELAAEEMRRRGDPQIGSEHLLVGLLREGEGMGARILMEFGADLIAVLGRLEEFGEKDAASMSVDSAEVHVDRRWRRVWCGACNSVEQLVVHLEPDGAAVGHHLDLLCGRCQSVVVVLHPAPAGQPE